MSSPGLVLDGIERLYRAAVDPGCWPDALDILREIFTSDACAVARHDFGARDGAYLRQAGYRPDLIERYPGPLARANPWLRDEARFRTPGAAWTGRDLASDRELLQSPFYADWLQPQDLLHQSCGVIAREGDAVIYLENLRHSARKAFDRRHLRAYAILLPHLQRAWTLARLLPGAARQTAPLDQTVRQARQPLILLDERAGVLAASGTARRFAGAGPMAADWRMEASETGALVRDGGRVAWSAPESEKVFADVIPLPARLTGGGPPRALALLDAEPGDDEAPDAARLAAIRGTPYFRAAAPEDRLRLLYRLTRAEARLALLLARGRTLQAAAKTLGRGITTVRTHLQRIFAKTGTSRQSELVVLLLTGPAGLQGE